MIRTLSFLLAIYILPVGLGARDFHVYYLGGQSNMDGYGFVKELPEDLNQPVEGAWVFHGNTAKDGTLADGRGKWSVLKPGHGRNFKSDGKTNIYSDRFGLELTFVRAMQKAHPDRNIAIIKYSLGGTSIDPEASAAERFGCWDTEWSGGEGAGKGINQFDHFLATLKNARADKDIDDDGEPDKLIPAGILWMQGESDAMEPVVAEEYQENLADLMEEIREAFGDTKIAIGRITDWEVWTHGEVVRKAQADFVAEDGNAALVTSTDEYGKSDKWHYDTAGYIDLGEKFAGAFEEKE
jgi:hypothetical protein